MLTTRQFTSRKVAAIAAAGLLAAGIAACSSSSSPPSSGATGGSTSGASSQPALVMESSPENSITQDFNPFPTTAPIYSMGADGLTYELLLPVSLASPRLHDP